MHCLAILIEGAADKPVEQLRGRTPLQVARAPSMHALAQGGRTGVLAPPESDDTPPSLLWPLLDLPTGVRRSACEWVAAGGAFQPDLQVCHASLVTVVEGLVHDTSVSLSWEETEQLTNSLQAGLPEIEVRILSPGHLLFGARGSEHMPNGLGLLGARGKSLVSLLQGCPPTWSERLARASELLRAHPINEVRLDLGENPANGIYAWDGGPSQAASGFVGPRRGVVLAHGPSARGAARLAGWDVIPLQSANSVEGDDPAFDVPAMVEALRHHKNCLVAIDSPGFLGQSDGPSNKVRMLDLIDFYVIRHLRTLMDAHRPRRLTLLADGAVSSQTGRPVQLPLPFAIMGDGLGPDPVERFSELDCRSGGWGTCASTNVKTLVWNDI